jgi:hypothetical protein
MNKLNPKLLLSDDFQEIDLKSSLKGTNTRGSYNPMQFVIRFRDDIHKALKINSNHSFNFDRIQAFSTFLHENIHWWQHVGSNIGFISSLSYPVIAHLAHKDLKTLIKRKEQYKSIMDYDSYYYSVHGKYDNMELNRILNNWYDILYARSFILDNKSIYQISKDRRFFLSLGHSFHILWSSSINILASTIDPTYKFLPKINEWFKEFERMEAEKIIGFVIDGDIGISPIGARAIFEGQARFNQLQYLTIASNNELLYSDFENMGMLSKIYIEAFDLFLEISKIEKPTNFNNSIIGLFLLICDIAINPTEGFPLNVFYFESFIISNDPGIRFVTLCQIVKLEKEKWINSVKEYSSQEYKSLSIELSEAIACFSPLHGSSNVINWIQNESIKDLMNEEKNMKFSSENLSLRLFFSKYFRFQEDKLKYPNIFCWIGKCMTEEASSEINIELVEKIFYKHQALFIEDIDGEIKPILFTDFPLENIQDTFNSFYGYNITYDMIIKWLTESGEFTYNYKWLSAKHKYQDMKEWVRKDFKNIFNIYPEELIILK